MQTVIQTPTFLADAKAAGLDDAELAEITVTIAANPLVGDIIPARVAPERSGSVAEARASLAGIGSLSTTLPRTCLCSSWHWSTKAHGPTSAKPTGALYGKSLAPWPTSTAKECVRNLGDLRPNRAASWQLGGTIMTDGKIR
jgi:hypothetical protein